MHLTLLRASSRGARERPTELICARGEPVMRQCQGATYAGGWEQAEKTGRREMSEEK